MKRRLLLSLQLGLVALCAALFVPHPARAHTLPISTLTLVPDETYLHLELTLNPFELTFYSELDANRDGRLDPREWSGHGEYIARRILEGLKLRVNDRPVEAEIAGLSQSYESHHLAVRAHFAVDARQARVSIESRLASLTSGSHVTEVNFVTGDRVQAARLDMQSNRATFGPVESATAAGPTAGGAVVGESPRTVTASQANELAVATLLGLLLLAGVPPAFFCALLRRRRLAQALLAPVTPAAAPSAIH
jgi:hypothetical protein